MALKMTSREVDGVTVVALDGRIVLGEESNALREKIEPSRAAFHWLQVVDEQIRGTERGHVGIGAQRQLRHERLRPQRDTEPLPSG